MDGAILDQLNQKAESLKPGSEIVIKMTQNELGKNLQGRLKDGSFFEYDPKKKQVIIYKPKKENVACAEEALKEGLTLEDTADACSDEISISLDVKGLAEEIAEKEQQVKELEKMVKAEGYLGYLQEKIVLIGKNVDNKKLVLGILNEIIRKIKLGNLKGNEYGEQIGRVLRQLNAIYKLKGDKVIPNKVSILLKKLNLD